MTYSVEMAVSEAFAILSGRIAEGSSRLGKTVRLREDIFTERATYFPLSPPGLWSANRKCRMVQTHDGWISVNLPRQSDLELVPAWIGCGFDREPWPAIVAAARERHADELVNGAQQLSLAVARVGSVVSRDVLAPLVTAGDIRSTKSSPLRVVDLSALWAGPLCGALLAEMGADVLKIDSTARPDDGAFYEWLNGMKTHRALDFRDSGDVEQLRSSMLAADVVITSARPRAFDQLGISLTEIFQANPSLVWVAITGYGWLDDRAGRVAFGDDAAAAGGLVRWSEGHPLFFGDAIADPLTGLAAAAGAFEALTRGGGYLVDAALARTAAGTVHKLTQQEPV